MPPTLAPQIRSECKAFERAYCGLAVRVFGTSTLRETDANLADLLAEAIDA
jgi:hypothetical protein